MIKNRGPIIVRYAADLLLLASDNLGFADA
jgi:hypothetical protein